MKNEQTLEYREKKANEIARTATIIGGIGLGMAVVSMSYFFVGDMVKAFFAFGWCALFHYQANTLVERSYRLKGY